MGGKQSHHHHHHHHQKAGSAQPKQTAEATATAATTESAQPPQSQVEPEIPPGQTFDVIISSTSNSEDIQLAQLVKAGLETVSVPAYSSSSDSAAKVVGKLLVDAKLLVFVVSEEAAKSSVCQDQVSLAYISNKPIIVAARKKKADLLKEFGVGMKLTLQSLHWSLFEKPEEQEANCRNFIQLIQEQIKPQGARVSPGPERSIDRSTTIVRRGGRLNTKLHAQTTVKDLGGEELTIDTFWDRNFPEEDEVAWYKFQQGFLKDYEAQLSGLFNDENVPWLLNMLKNDVFRGKEKVTKGQFMEVRGDSADKNAFWRVVSQIAVEKFNMKEVFDMRSTVRLAAIEKLSAFQNPAVIEALLQLFCDPDPNVRAVAAISLGRTGRSEEYILDALIKLLEDNDRIVRQSACLSLGTLKAVKAIPAIGNIWRNDFISVVRNAARTALENMNIPEAEEVLKVTKVLEDEIAALSTVDHQVAV